MTLFKGYVAVDWSASTTPVHGATSIWIAVCDAGGMQELVNPHTRQDAMDHIETLLNKATAEGRRLICGFDFAFGYPEGTAWILTGQNGWEAVWRRIAEVITDGPRNANNRFDAAAGLNGAFQGAGPFWGNGLARDIVGMEDAIVPFWVGITDEQIAPKAERDHPTTVVIRQLYFFDTQLLRRGEFNPSQIVR